MLCKIFTFFFKLYLHKAETKIALSAKAGILGVDFIINISSIYIQSIYRYFVKMKALY